MFIFDGSPIQDVLRIPAHRTPVLAVLDSGLDARAPLPDGCYVIAARSFVGEDPRVDALGWGTGWTQLYADLLADEWRRSPLDEAQWTELGLAQVKLVVGQVVSRDGVGHPEALAKALAWVARIPGGVDVVVAPWASSQVKPATPSGTRTGRGAPPTVGTRAGPWA